MMTYALAGLLRVRNFREESAANEVVISRNKVEEAEELIQMRDREKDAYRKQRLAEEEQLYQAITGRLVRQKDLEYLKQTVLLLRERELAYVKACQDARAQKKAAEKKLATATQTWRKAVREKEKIVAHREIWQEEANRENERQAELESEDFRVKPMELIAEATA